MGSQGMFATPGYSALQENFENEILWGHDAAKGMARYFGALILGSARDSTNSPLTTILRPGLILAKTSTGWTNYSAAGTGGQQIARAILPEELNMHDWNEANQDRLYRVLVRGPVRAAALYGLDAQARMQLSKQGFQFDDFFPNVETPWIAETTYTASAALTATDSGILVVGNHATVEIVMTLPAIAPGLHFTFVNIGAANLKVSSPEGDNLVVGNDASADSFTCSTAGEIIGAAWEVVANAAGTKWYVFNRSCPKTATTGLTVTIAT